MEKGVKVEDEAQDVKLADEEKKKEKLVKVEEIECISRLFKEAFGGELMTDQVEVELVMSKRQGHSFVEHIAYQNGIYADKEEMKNAGTVTFEIDGVQWKVFIKAR